MMAGFTSTRERIEVQVDLDIEKTPESFHVYAIPHDFEVQEGDVVQLHDAPTEIGYGEIMTLACRATLRRATWWERRWTRLSSMLELTELYEVGFQPAGSIEYVPHTPAQGGAS